MNTVTENNLQYRLPGELNEFQRRMYIHLINWKWKHVTKEPGFFEGTPYDALLPEKYGDDGCTLYGPIRDRFRSHHSQHNFRLHRFMGHMASSQAACVNLFLPLLEKPEAAAKALRAVKPDLRQIATGCLDAGYRLEFWDHPDDTLNDHDGAGGTNADIAIAYYDMNNELNLWLIEHKLTERDFSHCGGYTSGGNVDRCGCENIGEVLENPSKCYYRNTNKFHYWDITLRNDHVFPPEKLLASGECPFKGGMNQLWRNQLMALSIEESTLPRWPYRRVFFSVAHHPDNTAIGPTIARYKALTENNDRFSSFTTAELINAAEETADPTLSEWISWYRAFYCV